MSLPSQPVVKARVLIADDEENSRLVLSKALDLLGYRVEAVPDGKRAMERLSIGSFDVLLLDLRMPEADGVQVMEFIRQNCPDLAVIVLTAYATLDSAITAVKVGVVDYLLKPQRIAEIEEAVQRALKRRSIERQRQRLVGIMQGALQELQSQQAWITDRPNPGLPVPPSPLFLDLDQRKLMIKRIDTGETRQIELTGDQAAILHLIMSHTRKAFSNREIAIAALGYHDLSEKEAERIVRPHILRLRRKIESDPCRPAFIHTVRGLGYSYSPE
jgi:DNA-binding response OmpR family regulator